MEIEILKRIDLTGEFKIEIKYAMEHAVMLKFFELEARLFPLQARLQVLRRRSRPILAGGDAGRNRLRRVLAFFVGLASPEEGRARPVLSVACMSQRAGR